MADIHFGTDGWRAIIGEDFTPDNLNRVVAAAARIFKEEAVAAGRDADAPGTLIVGHDCRQDAHAYAELAAQVAERGLQRAAHRGLLPHPPRCAGRWPITTTRWVASCSRAPITPPSIWA